ncbi:asparagine synthase-related protein [Fulvivirgaceae bacterium BMA10]|uniref:asparagine synthase (glutamine-hydrolyzing) n=1 Tax=Splendidivirga corallicola TaxID=3051826 RepID=A0ABT8KSX7_9BACT|nr:asparagine synthase-related protein [Fulvivirgaceae bacterium BMA10]
METSIIPSRTIFHNTSSNEIVDFDFKVDSDIDFKALCYFVATGFFLGDTTQFKKIKALLPASTIDLENGKIKKQESRWKWHYTPQDISLKEAVEQFRHLFDKITKDQIQERKVIVPLSGGLDSRTQAAVLGKYDNVISYCYQFEDGINENQYGEAIAKVQQFEHHSFIIPRSYLWGVIDELADLNRCLSDFTHPRPMAIKEKLGEMGDLFFLGHWGDVLFDDMRVDENLSETEQVNFLYKKLIKKGGVDLAEELWKTWGLEGKFVDCFKAELTDKLAEIKIDNLNAKIRAFKSLYWAPRWTSTNLCVWQDVGQVELPYYHDEMCKFICTLPEKYLAGRQIQIEYLKQVAPDLAKIPWQSYHPKNLYNYESYYSLSNFPLRAMNNLKRTVNHKFLKKRPITLRNWEIQFQGHENDVQLRKHIFDNKAFEELVPREIAERIYKNFIEGDSVWFSHPLSMLLTLSVFANKRSY